MTIMIERVAAAMWLRSHDSPFESASPAARVIYLADARAAVEAMRAWIDKNCGESVSDLLGCIDVALADFDAALSEQPKSEGTL